MPLEGAVCGAPSGRLPGGAQGHPRVRHPPCPKAGGGQGLTRTRGHATPRSWPPSGAWKLVEAPLAGEKPGTEIRSRPLSISHEDFDRRVENLGISP